MKLVSKFNDDWALYAIEAGEESPMENHLSGEIAVDNENKRFYMHEIFIVCYGTDSVIKSCNQYQNRI